MVFHCSVETVKRLPVLAINDVTVMFLILDVAVREIYSHALTSMEQLYLRQSRWVVTLVFVLWIRLFKFCSFDTMCILTIIFTLHLYSASLKRLKIVDIDL